MMTGRPLKYTPEELKKVIDNYFATTKSIEWTVSGLGRVIGSKQLMNDYEGREEYADMVKDAKLRIEEDYEKELRRVGGAANIFAMKNFGWKDESSVNVNPPIKLDL